MSEILMSFQGKDNAKEIDRVVTQLNGTFTSRELFQDKPHGHKFKVGEKVTLHGLVDYPQFNGELVAITAFREDGPHGLAYYFKTDNEELSAQLNWTYEYRLVRV